MSVDPAAPGTNRFAMTVNLTASGLAASDTDEIDMSGSLLADLEFSVDPATEEVSGISALEFSGGKIVLSEADLDLSYGAFGGVLLTSTPILGHPDTVFPPGGVTNFLFSSAEHQLVLTNGTYSAVPYGLVSGQVGPTNIVVSPAAPIESNMGTENGQFFVSAPVVTNLTATYTLVGIIPISVSAVVLSNATMVARTTIVGTAVSRGQFSRTIGDLDNDGIPNLLDDDDDNDGATDVEEGVAGTDGLNAASFLRLGVKRAGAESPELQVETVSGRVYRIDCTTVLDGGTWVNIATNIPGSDSLFTLPITGDDRRFYRLGVRQSP